MTTPERILILAPHTDDGELGCGGTIAKWIGKGKEVFYAAFSLCKRSLPAALPEDTLEHECKAATQLLGISPGNLRFFDFEVREFTSKRQQILEELVKLNTTLQPGMVLIPCSGDIHQDHGVLYTEALRAFKNSSVLGYELPWNHASFRATYFVQLSDTEIDKKVKALAAYQSQQHRNYMQPDFIRGLAKVRGVQCNAEYAEAFEVYKMIS